ncbi:hypothetical protein PF327_01900 [Sulfurovum sp. XTW-4]|uniref:Formylmethanofuran dehydrogenase subunit E domain-containing protein n=2 Tax=Sulfurovum xiamenensis TaxID=3019066 RepID=A0ABT7QPF3_9BACT|nr:hypothetical protein [Sulfurovum xiamenensis]MDM5262943.1 hypothetical protein [Sulfurovum xiamenensis]
MKYPLFFDEVDTIQLYDPLSDFLGAFEEGKVEIGYLDCVKQAGHSCPTVAGAYLMTMVGLKMLYGTELPQRGNIYVGIKGERSEGTIGVIGNIISFIVGASGEEGFKGIQGRFSRDHLLAYDQKMMGEVTLKRMDNDTSVSLSYDPSVVPGDQRLRPLMGKILQGKASDLEEGIFKELWQSRVKEILLSTELSNKIIQVY